MTIKNKKKVALVTGASSGIGRATAVQLAQDGIDISITGRDEDNLASTAKLIRDYGAGCHVIAADLSDENTARNVVNETIDHFGKLDILINAAGIIGSGSVVTTTLEAWDKMMNINLRSLFVIIQEAVPHLEKTSGNIVNVSSVTGSRSFPGILCYCVSKAGVDQITRCIALELAERSIRVNAINPGVVRTQLHKNGGMDSEAYASFLEHSKTTHPLGRIGEPQEAAELITFLASDKAAWITGACIPLDGGRAQTCAR
ncbi:glucose 1-dehydrogenase [bacterium]|nr:glucose 1-dehydrogenase [bacterium]